MTILITGASGHLGQLVVRSLLAQDVPVEQIVAGARDLTRVEDLARLGVRSAVVDYDRPETLREAFAGVDKLLFISGSEVGKRAAQHRAVVDAAEVAAVSLLAYTSGPHATTAPLVVNPDHKLTEELILAAGLPHVFLRNNWYVENYLPDLRHAKESGAIVNSIGDGLVAGAPRSDFAEAAAKVLTTEGHTNQVYELTGDVAWSMSDLASAASEVLGREIVYTPVSPEEEIASLTAVGLPAEVAGVVGAINGNVRDGLLGEATSDMATLLGRPTTPLVDAVRSALS